jgi:ABC-type Na+ efflux pump permease subunit
MRLLSEEQRVGTLEVLLTAPVNEWTVVLSKFFAALIFYLLAWLPWGVFLVALRVFSGEAFDYRPLLSFAITFTCTGAGFVAAGLFCSSMTRNQIIAAVFTFVIMLAHTGTHLIRYFARIPETSGWMEVLTYVSYLDLWLLSLQGLMAPRFLVFHLSLAVFFLFLSVKVLEARKWT